MVDVKMYGKIEVILGKAAPKLDAFGDIQIWVRLLQVAWSWMDNNNKRQGRQTIFLNKQLVRVSRSMRFLEPPTR